jgi:hypothetical protein
MHVGSRTAAPASQIAAPIYAHFFYAIAGPGRARALVSSDTTALHQLDKRPFLALALVVPLVPARAIRSTPAEALGLIDQAWSIGELLDAFPLNLTLRDRAFTKSVAVFLGSAPLLNLA